MVSLSPQHMKMLREESAISRAVIEGRGYETVTAQIKMQRLGFGVAQRIVPTLVMPVWDVFGELAMYHHRPDNPRMRDGKIVKYEIPAGRKVAVDVHPLIREQVRDPGVPLWITEGVKKADAAISFGLCCIALIGVWNWRGSNEWGGKTVLPDWDGIALKDTNNQGRQVYIAFDSDVMLKPGVSFALDRLAAFLEHRGARVAFVYLPPGHDGRKVGLDDFLAEGHTVEDLSRLSTTQRRPIADDGQPENKLPVIETNGRQLRDVTADSVTALIAANRPPGLFVRNGRLAYVDRDENAVSYISSHTMPTMRNRLAEVADWVSTSEKRGRVNVYAPREIAEAVLSLPAWRGIPPLLGVVTAPVVAPDGTLLTAPGYHEQSRLYYDASDCAKLPDTTPSEAAIRAARSQLLDNLLGDFPFADEASRAHALALLLLPFVRPLIPGPTPLHLVDAPKAGTGKGLLAAACAGVFVPGGAPVKSVPTTEEEWAKLLTGVFRAGVSHLILDNARALNSPALFAALTSETWQDRALGSNDLITAPNRLIWAATANNVAGNDELTRRAVWIRLDAGVEQPDERQTFRHADLLRWVRQNRAQLIGAALTLIRAWLGAGRPTYTAQTLGSFAGWTQVMGGILEAADVPGFLGNRAELRARTDKETTAWYGFFDAWAEARGERPSSVDDLLPIAIHWFAERLGDGQERSQKMRLGKLLAASVDRVYNGQKLTAADKVSSGMNKGAAQYRLCKSGNLGNMGNLSAYPIESILSTDSYRTHNTLQEARPEVPDVPQVPPSPYEELFPYDPEEDASDREWSWPD